MKERGGKKGQQKATMTASGLDVFSKLSNDISLNRVLAHIEMGEPEACGEYTRTVLDCASNLSGGFPNDLSEMRRLRVA